MLQKNTGKNKNNINLMFACTIAQLTAKHKMSVLNTVSHSKRNSQSFSTSRFSFLSKSSTNLSRKTKKRKIISSVNKKNKRTLVSISPKEKQIMHLSIEALEKEGSASAFSRESSVSPLSERVLNELPSPSDINSKQHAYAANHLTIPTGSSSALASKNISPEITVDDTLTNNAECEVIDDYSVSAQSKNHPLTAQSLHTHSRSQSGSQSGSQFNSPLRRIQSYSSDKYAPAINIRGFNIERVHKASQSSPTNLMLKSHHVQQSSITNASIFSYQTDCTPIPNGFESLNMIDMDIDSTPIQSRILTVKECGSMILGDDTLDEKNLKLIIEEQERNEEKERDEEKMHQPSFTMIAKTDDNFVPDCWTSTNNDSKDIDNDSEFNDTNEITFNDDKIENVSSLEIQHIRQHLNQQKYKQEQKNKYHPCSIPENSLIFPQLKIRVKSHKLHFSTSIPTDVKPDANHKRIKSFAVGNNKNKDEDQQLSKSISERIVHLSTNVSPKTSEQPPSHRRSLSYDDQRSHIGIRNNFGRNSVFISSASSLVPSSSCNSSSTSASKDLRRISIDDFFEHFHNRQKNKEHQPQFSNGNNIYNMHTRNRSNSCRSTDTWLDENQIELVHTMTRWTLLGSVCMLATMIFTIYAVVQFNILQQSQNENSNYFNHRNIEYHDEEQQLFLLQNWIQILLLFLHDIINCSCVYFNLKFSKELYLKICNVCDYGCEWIGIKYAEYHINRYRYKLQKAKRNIMAQIPEE